MSTLSERLTRVEFKAIDDYEELYAEHIERASNRIINMAMDDLAVRFPKRTLKFISGMGTCFLTVDDDIIDYDPYAIMNDQPIHNPKERLFTDFYRIIVKLQQIDFWAKTNIALNDFVREPTV